MYNPWQQGCVPSPENALVMNPCVPFWGPIAGGMEIGKMIEVSGHVPFAADRFVINLCVGPDQGPRQADKALHISVRFDELSVVRNTMQNEWWGEEERAGGFPFSPGKEFTVLILNEVNSLRIAINGEHYTEYAHRLPFASVTMLNVHGSVTLTKIAFTDQRSSLSQGTAPSLSPVMNQPTPITYPIQGGLFPGKMIYISGRPTSDNDRFSINLQCGTASYPPPDIALHFDVRLFNTTVVRNSLINDCWGEEELSIPYFPCQPGVNFDMIIRVEQDKYLVAFNGQHFIEYRHRLQPVTRVDTLNIVKDVFITSIGIV